MGWSRSRRYGSPDLKLETVLATSWWFWTVGRTRDRLYGPPELKLETHQMTSRWFWRVGVRENECGEGLGLPRFGSILDHGMSLHLDESLREVHYCCLMAESERLRT